MNIKWFLDRYPPNKISIPKNELPYYLPEDIKRIIYSYQYGFVLQELQRDIEQHFGELEQEELYHFEESVNYFTFYN